MSANCPQPPSNNCTSAIGRASMDAAINETKPDATAEDKESPAV